MKFKSTAARRIATAIAAFGVLTMSSGVALMVTATPANADPISQPNPNHEDYWEDLPGEVCTKTDTGAESGNVILPAEPAGRDYSQLIIKKGSGNIGVENQIFNNPDAGQPGYEWVGSNPQQSGGWSHYIVCTVPEPEVPFDECDNLPGDQPEGTPCSKDDLVEYGNWVDQAWECEDTTTTQTRTKTVTTYAWDGDSWEPNAPVVTVENQIRQLTPQEITECPVPPVAVTPPAPQFVDPTCDDPTADVVYTDVPGVVYSVVGEIAPGALVEVQATAAEGYEFPEAVQTSWEHTFDEVPTDCTIVDTPETPETPETPDEDTPDTTVATPTVVHAGLTDAGDLRGEQGLALLLAGMIITLGAGTVAVRTSRG